MNTVKAAISCILMTSFLALTTVSVAEAASQEELLRQIQELKSENAELRSRIGLQKHKKNSSQITAIPASSSDVPQLPNIKDAIAQAPVSASWSGFYAGLNAGYGWGTSNTVQAQGVPVLGGSFTPLAPLSGITASNSGSTYIPQDGFIGGAQIGYNRQFQNTFLVGLEADIQGANMRGNGGYLGAANIGYNVLGSSPGSISSTGTGSISAGIDWLGTVRGRLGYLIIPNLLTYATGGLTYAGTSTSYNNTGNFLINVDTASYPYFGGGYGGLTSSQSNIRTGWNVGGGAEWMFAKDLSLKAEALYYDLGTSTISTAAFTSLPVLGIGDINAALFSSANIRFQGVIARAGMNYHFNFANVSPVVAKY